MPLLSWFSILTYAWISLDPARSDPWGGVLMRRTPSLVCEAIFTCKQHADGNRVTLGLVYGETTPKMVIGNGIYQLHPFDLDYRVRSPKKYSCKISDQALRLMCEQLMKNPPIPATWIIGNSVGD
jgi:hypothetical protein